jgi:diguanylate cyclase (GGDEF)-like protein/PAS domain S-box-containing protein
MSLVLWAAILGETSPLFEDRVGTIAEDDLSKLLDGEAALSGPGRSCSPLVARNGTARGAAKRLLRPTEALYRTSFEQAAVGILHTGLDGRILECNECFARLVGYTRLELVGADFQAITPPEDRGMGNTAQGRLLRGEMQTVSFEKRYLRKDGVLTWVMLTISVQHDEKGRPLCFFTVVQDINARKQTEEQLAKALAALRMSEERYRTTFQMSLDAMNLTRLSDGAYLDCNKAFLDATGYTREEVIGHTSAELKVWADPEDRQRMIELLHREGACRNLEARFRVKSGKTLWGLLSASLIELNGAVCILAITRNVSDARAAEDEIRHLAHYDPLTELANRRLLLERLRQTVAASRRSGRRRALLFVDLDHFKTLNDTLGHNIGDLLLQEAARRLSGCIRAMDTAARIGGDEFVVILEELSGNAEEAGSQAEAVAKKILARLSEPYMLAGRVCLSTASVGITVFGQGIESTTEVLQQADIALDQAKSAGRESIRFFTPALQSAVNARAALEEELRQAIRKREFVLWYQPQVQRGQVIGAEALLRWNHPRRGILPPAQFIGLAEETGLIVPLGHDVVEAACGQIADWARDPAMQQLTLAVNVSARQFRQADFVEQVLSALDRTGADPRKLKLEITESMLLDNLEETIAIMTRLRKRGVEFSLDDFGTGYSSLAYLKRLPLDQLKIDRSFVRDMMADAASRAIAQAIVSLSRAMHLSLLAEGVETEEQRACLDDFGCHAYQGYLFSPPVPAEKFVTLLEGAA